MPFDAYAEYCAIYLKVYRSPPPPTRAEWNAMCAQGRRPLPYPSDVQWDYDREREGNAQ